jgi:hypothetical protein
MPAAIGYLVIDTTDPAKLAPFWCALLDVSVAASLGEGQFIVLSRTGDGLVVGFQQVPQGCSLDPCRVASSALSGRLVVSTIAARRRTFSGLPCRAGRGLGTRKLL